MEQQQPESSAGSCKARSACPSSQGKDEVGTGEHGPSPRQAMDLTLCELGTRMKPASHKPTASTTSNGINHLYEIATSRTSDRAVTPDEMMSFRTAMQSTTPSSHVWLPVFDERDVKTEAGTGS